MNTDTPRTDEAAVEVWRRSDGKRMETRSDKVDADFARQLERELAEAREEIDLLKSQLTKTHGCVTISRNGYVQEIEQQRDRLAEAMREMWPFIEEDDYGTLNTPAFSAAIKKYKQALDDVKGDPQ